MYVVCSMYHGKQYLLQRICIIMAHLHEKALSAWEEEGRIESGGGRGTLVRRRPGAGGVAGGEK